MWSNPDSLPKNSRPISGMLFSTIFAVFLVYGLPTSELNLFARGAAILTSFLTGAPLTETGEGWLLPILSQQVLVNKSCSGSGFFILICTIMGWHIGNLVRPAVLSASITILFGLCLTFLANALRITCLSQAHYWVIPELPENYASFTHMLIGMAVFLPALICTNAALSYYVRQHIPTS